MRDGTGVAVQVQKGPPVWGNPCSAGLTPRRKACFMVLSTPFLVVFLVVGLAFLVFINIAVMDRLEDYKLNAKGK